MSQFYKIPFPPKSNHHNIDIFKSLIIRISVKEIMLHCCNIPDICAQYNLLLKKNVNLQVWRANQLNQTAEESQEN